VKKIFGPEMLLVHELTFRNNPRDNGPPIKKRGNLDLPEVQNAFDLSKDIHRDSSMMMMEEEIKKN